MIKVLKEIGIPEETFAKRYLEVWNKIDLIQDQEQFENKTMQEQGTVE